MPPQYTYKCRECLVRVRVMCIQEAQISPGAKRIIERAFESHTDTEATWALLQKNCLLVRRDGLVIDDPQPPQQGLLGRMRKPAAAAPPPTQQPPPANAAPLTREAPVSPTPVRPAAQTERPQPPIVSAPPESVPPRETASPAMHGGLLARLQQHEQEKEGETPVITPPATTELEQRRRDRLARAARPPVREQEAGPRSRTSAPLWAGRESEADLPIRTTPADLSAEPLAPPPAVPSEEPRLSLLDRLRSREGSSTLSRPSTDELLRHASKNALVEIQYPPAVRPAVPSYQVSGPKMLVVESTGHRILLPENGDLVLGRLDPLAQIKPDIDLTFEDQPNHGISRRHAAINGWHGRYEVTDLGSGNGTWINGSRLELQRTVILQVGDEIRLGSCAMFFDRAPAAILTPSTDGHFFFYVTFSGHFYPLPNKDVITIGRADPLLGFTPDVDLSDEGDASAVVSRHHAKLFRQGNRFEVEDLGSAFKTKIDGLPVYVGTRASICPGQHLWLGGCVLAFDVV